ncbi:tigger transposable element-derived protein 4-like [Patiria miniata]|uniref:HTH CENPB-type domain-containing protein n=1 Tax=Patiria miniata TaxID=46514 RepID=A0A914AVQ4_PATMI|nr:tigger transposable element-derived protein 4-like [Patiria miniata]
MASIPSPAIDVGLVDHNDYTARPEPDPTTEKKKEKKKKKIKDKKEKQPEDREKQIPFPAVDVSLVDHNDYTARPEPDPTTKKTTEDKEESIAANYYEFFNPEKRKQSQQEPTIDEPQPKRVCFPAAEEDLPLGKTTGAKSATVGKTASKLKTLLLADKVNLIDEVENCGMKNRTDIAAEWGISISELNGIMRKKGTVMEQFRKQCLIQARQVEEAVLMWCKAAQAMNILVTRQILEEKAKSLAKKLGFPNFTLSDGWLDLFKARNNVSFNVVARAGAAGVSDERKALSSTSQLRVHQMVKDWLITDLSPLLVVYKPSNIFNANETGIFYRLLPDRLLAFKGKACNGGERSEERLTAMVCANMDGSEKLPLLVIGNTKKPQCLANVKSLPTLYEANKTAWMTSDIFEAWARNIDKLCQKKNRKIAIVIDSCPAHPHITGLKSVTLVFLSPLTAANLQPMEQGIIRNLKMHYRRQLITSFLAAVDRKETYHPTVLDAMILLKKSWKMVRATTISHCFKLAGFERKKTATILDIETAEPDVDINAATEDKDLFDQLREAGMDIPQEITLKSYAAVDADVRCTTGLSDDAILGAVSSSVAEVNNVEDDYESTTPYPDVSVAEAMQHLDKLQHFALQNHHTEGMLDAICDIEQVIGRVRKDNATQKT